MEIKLKCENLNELERELVTGITDDVVPEIINRYKRRELDFNYFESIGLARKVYRNWNYEVNIKFCDALIQGGIEKTYLDFKKISSALQEGEGKAEFFIALAKEGRGYIEKLTGQKQVLQ